MKTRVALSLAVCLLALLVVGGGAPAVGAPQGQPEAMARGPIAAASLQAPLTFEVNRGQTAAQVKYLSRGPGYTLFLTPGEAVLALQRGEQTPRDPGPLQPGTVLRMRLVGANPAPRVEGLEPLPGRSHYFIGNDPTKWRTDIPHYAKVLYEGVYPGIALIYYGSQRELEYDFVVAPGADPEAIRLAFTGVDRLSLDGQGNLLLHAAGGEVVQHAPRVYQERKGARQAVAGRYVLYGKDQVGFRVAAYDPTRPLVIDPVVLSYATYLGGSGDDMGLAIAVDKLSGNAYVTGPTASIDFPTTAGPGYGGGGHDLFVAKLDPTLAGAASLLYSTYVGGSGDDQGRGIAMDAAGNAYVTGTTFSTDFPATPSVYQTALAGAADALVVKLNPTGGLSYATYLGGSEADEGLGIAVDSFGQAYVTGRTKSSNFLPPSPTFTPFQATIGSTLIFDAFVAKLNSAGSALVYSTYLGGSGADEGLGIAVDTAGNAYVTGRTKSSFDPLISLSSSFPTTVGVFQSAFGGGLNDAFVAKLDPSQAGAASLLYSTYLGGSGNDQGFGIAVDGSGKAYVTGSTNSTTFPTVNAFQPTFGSPGLDAFVAKVNPAGSALVYSTYLGGSGNDQGAGIAVDAAGNAYVTGSTNSITFPTVNALTGCGTGVNVASGGDTFVVKLDPTLAGAASLLYSTFLGGGSQEFGAGIAVDGVGNAYVTASTTSTNFPLTAGAYQSALGGGQDAIVAKLGVVSPTFCVTVNSAGSGTGTVTSSPAVITCPGTCAASFPSGSVSLTANANGGSTFGGWSGCDTATGLTCTLTMSGPKSVMATFNAPVPPFIVTVNVQGTGTGIVTSDPTGISCPTGCSATFTSGVTLTAAPTGGSTFAGWSGGCSGSGPCSVSSTQSVTATFNPPLIPLMVSIGGTGTGTVTINPGGIICASSCTPNFTIGTFVTLTALPAVGSIFSWGVDCATFGPALTCTLTMDASKSVTATFSSGGGPGGGGGSCDSSNATLTRHKHKLDDPKVCVHLHRKPNEDDFKVDAFFTLGAGNNGIHPLTEAATLQVGPFTMTIPAGSFTMEGKHFRFKSKMKGPAGPDLDVKIEPKDKSVDTFKVKAHGHDVDLTGIMNEVPVCLTIGDDSASAMVTIKHLEKALAKGEGGGCSNH